ncbi:MAG: alginate lyase family protein [Planctomycetota bacterium]
MTRQNRLARRFSRGLALIRYHRPSQFLWRLMSISRRVLRRNLPPHWVFPETRRMARWKPQARESFRAIAQYRLGLWPGRAQHHSKIAEGTFQFLNEQRCLVSGNDRAMDWNPNAPRLWRFHLQCHEYLPELADHEGAKIAYDVLQSWLDAPRHRSPTLDPDAWHPFCISRRLPAWLSLLADHDPPDELSDRIWSSIAGQVSWLSRNCEWDLGGNHLLENLTSLLLADCFLEIEPASDLGFVLERILGELDEQILPSGEHFERTPTYHALMMVCVAECAEALDFANRPEKEKVVSTLRRMASFTEWIRQPDGHLPLLGDSARDETPDVSGMLRWALAFAPSERHHPEISDYWIAETERKDRLLFDVGPIACDHLPAHGHADLTQLVASIGGRDAIVDTGNYDYETSEIRRHCRSTEAHNVMHWRQQCDLWSTFRMGRRGHPVSSQAGSTSDWTWKAVCHDAYPALAGRVVVANTERWIVIDWADADPKDKDTLTSRLHWHPEWELRIDESENRVAATCAEQDRHYFIDAIASQVTIESGVYCPNFGERFENEHLVFAKQLSGSTEFGYQISLLPGEHLAPPQLSRRGRKLVLEFSSGPSLTCQLS